MVSDDGPVRNILQLTETTFLAGIYVVIELMIDTRKLLFAVLFVKKKKFLLQYDIDRYIFRPIWLYILRILYDDNNLLPPRLS